MVKIIPRRVLSIDPEGDGCSCSNYQISAIKMKRDFCKYKTSLSKSLVYALFGSFGDLSSAFSRLFCFISR